MSQPSHDPFDVISGLHPPLNSAGNIPLSPASTFASIGNLNAAHLDDDEMLEEAETPPPFLPPATSLSRPQKRAVAHPQRLDPRAPVLCYKYEQGRAAASDGRWQGQRAHLHYYLPYNWSASRKYSVFEDSFILSIPRPNDDNDSPTSPPTPPPPTTHQLPALEPQIPLPPHANVGALPSATYAYHLARPLSGARPSSRGAQGQDDARSGHHLRQDGRGDSSATMTPQQQGAQYFELVWPRELDRAILEEVEAACDRVVPGAKRKPHAAFSLSGVNLKLQKVTL